MRLALAAILAVASTVPATARGETVAVKAGRILTISGGEIENGVILVRDGRIEAVGQALEIPWDAKVVDASKQTVIPGFIEAHSWRGVDRVNDNVPSVPFLSTADSISAVDPYFEDCLRQGITTVFVLPGNSTRIGGMGCVVRPTGLTVEEMLVARDHAMKISLSPTSGMSRMAHVAALRKDFDDMIEFLRKQKERSEVPAGANGGKKPPTELDVKREPMAKLLDGRMEAFVYCPEAADVVKAIEIAAAYKLKVKLVLGSNTWKAAEDIAKAKLEVVLPADCVFWETDEERHAEVRRVLPEIFSKAGVTFAFQTDGGALGSSQMWYQAARAVRHGVPRDDALKAATLNAAKILGLGDRLGSIEKGKDANLVMLTGDPLSAQSWVDRVMIEGKVVYERTKDEKLKRVMDATR